MTTEYYYETSDTAVSKKKSNEKIEKGLKSLLIIAVIILSAELIWLFGVSPFIPFSSVEVHGFSGLTRPQILYLAGIDDSSSYFSTNVNIVKEKLSSNILVESAVVIKRFPDKLSIYLNPRQAAAVTLANINSKQVMIYIDRQGVFYKIESGDLREKPNIPVISGIENPQLNMRLPVALVPLAENLGKISVSSPELLSAISEIRIERKAWNGYDLVLFPVHSGIRVRVENNFTEDTLRYMLLMLNVFETDDKRPQEIDFRSGIGSYKVEELS
ncbi:cell division protein FtsQ/DivIB [Treponema sp. R80B11-R83G3]